MAVDTLGSLLCPMARSRSIMLPMEPQDDTSLSSYAHIDDEEIKDRSVSIPALAGEWSHVPQNQYCIISLSLIL